MQSWAPKHGIPYSAYARSKSMATFAPGGRDLSDACPYQYMVLWVCPLILIEAEGVGDVGLVMVM